MNIEQAKKQRDEYRFIIGQKAKVPFNDLTIVDVIAIPVKNRDRFVIEYRGADWPVNNDALCSLFEPNEFEVGVVLATEEELNHGLIDVRVDDISEYFDRKKEAS